MGILIDEGVLKVDQLKSVSITLGFYEFFLDKHADPQVLADYILQALERLYKRGVALEVLKITDALKNNGMSFILKFITVCSPVYSDGATPGK